MSLGPLMVDLRADSLSAQEKRLLLEPSVGGVILFSRNFTSVESLTNLVSEIHALRHPRLLVAVDQEGGCVQRFRRGFTQLPAIQGLGKIHDTDSKRACALAEITGWLMAAELRSVGIDFSFAPVLDLNCGVSWVIGERAFHKDPEIVAALATYYIRGMRRAGMQAVGKHFPGHGGVAADSHVDRPVDTRSYQDLLLQDILPFRRLINQSIAGIMSAHVIYEKIDEEVATYSKKWLHTVLREQLDFKGAVFSDDLSMKAADCSDEYPVRTRKALQAGCDMVLICNDSEQAVQVAEQLRSQDSPASQIRLARMHGGKHSIPYKELRVSDEWQSAVLQVESYLDQSDSDLLI
ncbi:MAG: beta-N-acetylhexosaminidase [Gammaproteobacteria bacterium]|nr:beta-N-acetylhexosaminidase [Gammaproteobacteria bacterium]